MEAFHEQLDVDTARESILLKYCLRLVNGTPFWTGLRAAKGSADVWKRFLINGSEIPEIGVYVDKKHVANSSKQDPLIGWNGIQIKAAFGFGVGMSQVAGSTTGFITTPPTYEVRENHWTMSHRLTNCNDIAPPRLRHSNWSCDESSRPTERGAETWTPIRSFQLQSANIRAA